MGVGTGSVMATYRAIAAHPLHIQCNDIVQAQLCIYTLTHTRTHTHTTVYSAKHTYMHVHNNHIY